MAVRVRWGALAGALVSAAAAAAVVVLWCHALRHAAPRGPAPCAARSWSSNLSVHHPRNPRRWTQVRAEGLYVSPRADRGLPAPLDGMVFDAASAVYIFLWLPPAAPAAPVTVQFVLDGQPVHTTVARQAAVDLVGAAARAGTRALPFHTQALAAPLAGSGLGCHELAAHIFHDGEPAGRVLRAQFQLAARPPAVWLMVTVSLEFDLRLLPHFVAHYLAQGVRADHMVVVLHTSDPAAPDSVWANVTAMLAATGIRPYHYRGTFDTFRKFETQETLARQLVLQQDWVLHADVDEFQIYPGGVTQYLDRAAAASINAVFGQLRDRVAASGRLAPVPPESESLFAHYDLTCDITGSVASAFVSKLVAHRGYLMAEEGTW